MVAGDADFTATVKFPVKSENKYIYDDNNVTQKNPLIVVSYIPEEEDFDPDDELVLEPVSLLKCDEENKACKVQILPIVKSYISTNYSRRVRISTKSTGAKNLYHTTSPNMFTELLLVANKNNMKFKYEKDSTDLTHAFWPEDLENNESKLTGEFTGVKTLGAYVGKFSDPPHQMALSWSPDNSASNDDWLFPEIDITIPSKGGVFTKENSDVSFPYNPGPDPSPSPEPASPSPEPESPTPEPISPSYQPESPTPEPYSPGPMPPTYKPGSETPEPYSPSHEPESPTANPETSTTTHTTSTDPSGQKHGKAWVAPVLGSLGGLIVVIVIAAIVVVYIIGRRKEPKSEISQANLLSQEV